MNFRYPFLKAVSFITPCNMRIKHAPTRSSQNHIKYATLRERIFDTAFRVKLKPFDDFIFIIRERNNFYF